MAHLFRAALVRRFWKSLREEGLRQSLARVRLFVGRTLRGAAPSLFGAPSISAQPHEYMQGLWAELARGDGFHVRRRPGTPPRIALIGDLNLAQCRKYRVEQIAAFWRSQGVPCDYAHYEDVPRVMLLMQEATHVWEYRLFAAPLTMMYRYEARRLGLPVLYDIDDPLFSISAYETYRNMAHVPAGQKAHFLAAAPLYAEAMNSADLLTFSTPGLVEHARLYTGRPAYLRRNFADDETLRRGAEARKRREPGDGLFRVCFASGSQGHEADFALIAEEVAAFVAADPSRRLLILGHFDLKKLPEALADRTEHLKFVPYDDYLNQLVRADVAVMPLQDDAFNRCKSGVRVIDAASVGLPSIVSAVGDLPNLIEDRVTGMVAQGPGDFAAALTLLAGDADRRLSMGVAARTALEDRWSASAAPHIIAPEVVDWVHR